MYCIYLRPKGDCLAQIEKIRKLYDPLANLIEAHITLLHPTNFKDVDKIVSLLGQMNLSSFNLEPNGVKESLEGNKNYLFLRFKNDQIIKELHNELYLKFFHQPDDYNYIPHITLACFNEKNMCLKVKEELKLDFHHSLKVEELCLEKIAEDGKSVLLYTKTLL
ncbi:MAG: 2'-5' RNA ligase family protein [Anaeroplasmataceae bacterium]|nr:2'-5' RNA ligase family protein [Anaeroplasmataceae bacterium]